MPDGRRFVVLRDSAGEEIRLEEQAQINAQTQGRSQRRPIPQPAISKLAMLLDHLDETGVSSADIARILLHAALPESPQQFAESVATIAKYWLDAN
jgi:hypothetical protein